METDEVKVFLAFKGAINDGDAERLGALMTSDHVFIDSLGNEVCGRENRISMPAAWKAVIDGNKVKEWRVFADRTEGQRIMQRDAESRPGAGDGAVY